MKASAMKVHSIAVCLVMLLLGIMPASSVAAAGERWCPPETGYCSENAFYDFWRAHGALEILGYPVDSPRRAPNGQLVQIYERAIMEWHPENNSDYQVLLTRLAAIYLEGTPPTKQPPVPCDGNCALLGATNHTLRGAFLSYWNTYGGLAVFGFPLTEQLQERNSETGQVFTVQYFERYRLEYHPENAGTRYEVLLGRLGAEFLAALGADVRSWPVASVPNYGGTTPPPPPAPSPVPPQPTPAPTPVPANPSVSISPASGPAGTKFIATGTGLPVAATVGWVVSYGGATTNSGTFQLDPGQTTFNFTLSTDGSAAGAYAISFTANGRAIGGVGFTITGPPPSSGASAQLKAQIVAGIDQTLPSLQEVLNICPGANPLVCQAKYDEATRAYNRLGDTFLNLTGSAPSQCSDLLLRVMRLRSEGAKWWNTAYVPTRQGFIDRNEATNRAYNAGLWLSEARRVVLQEPGTCH